MENNEIEFHNFFSNFAFHANGTDEKKRTNITFDQDYYDYSFNVSALNHV